MARYFFHVTDGHAVALDYEGAELPDDRAAMAEAFRDVRQLMGDSDAQGECRRHWRMDVMGAAGALVFRLPFGHALTAVSLKVA